MKYIAFTLSLFMVALFSHSAVAQVRDDIANYAEDVNDRAVVGLALDGLAVPPNRTYAISLDNGSYSGSNGIALQFGYRYDDDWSGDGGFAFSEKTQRIGARISLGREW